MEPFQSCPWVSFYSKRHFGDRGASADRYNIRICSEPTSLVVIVPTHLDENTAVTKWTKVRYVASP